MVQTRILMGMPITVKILDANVSDEWFTKVYDYFDYVDHKFSTYKPDSEISQINAKKITKYSYDMRLILDLCEQTKKETNGFFDINHNGKLDPSGLVKGWSIFEAAKILKNLGAKEFFIDAGGDIEAVGKVWKIGIKNPFNESEIIKTITLQDAGVATSGTYIRGQHVYNPHKPDAQLTEIVSLTVVGPNVYEADRFATAAFAMGRQGIAFIQRLAGFSGYMIDSDGQATYTDNFPS